MERNSTLTLYRKIDDIDLLQSLEARFMVYTAKKKLIESILDKKYNIDLNEEIYNRLIDDYVVAYSEMSVYRRKIDEIYLPIQLQLHHSYYSNIHFNVRYISMDVNKDDNISINLLKEAGFMELEES